MKPYRNFHPGLGLSSSYRGGEGNRTLFATPIFFHLKISGHIVPYFFLHHPGAGTSNQIKEQYKDCNTVTQGFCVIE
jgi:hypothetical protein